MTAHPIRARARRTGALTALVTLLTGSALVVATGSPAASAGTCVPGTASPTVSVDTADPVLGGTLELSGTGWCHPTDGGSRIAIKIDEGGYSRIDSNLNANRTIWAIIDADAADGSFHTQIELPDGTTATSSPAFPTGEHTLRLLSGSLKSGDTIRTVASAAFTVSGTDDPTPPAWSHTTVTASGATAWIEDDLPAGSGATLRIAGTGWTRTGGGASSIAVKLGSGPDGEQYERSGSAVVNGDPTIWKMLTPSADGTLDTSLRLPAGLKAGQYLTVTLLTGKFASGDVQRSVTTSPLVVGGVAWEPEDPTDPGDPACTPTTTTPQVTLGATKVSFGGTLRITGTGWCHPTSGGSRIAVKIDEGAYSRLDSSLSSNRTIWAIVDADDTDGTFSANIRLPDGTTATSDPALPRGEHTLRLLTGSLLAGDTIRTVQSAPFVVGTYRPNGTPDPINAKKQLRAGTKHAMRASLSKSRLRVTLPKAAVGTWAFVSAYTADGSPRYPWTTWYRVAAGHRIDLPLTRKTRAGLSGRLRVVVQNGDLGHVGSVLGWAAVKFPKSGGKAPDQDGADNGDSQDDPSNQDTSPQQPSPTTPFTPTATPTSAIAAPSTWSTTSAPTAGTPPTALSQPDPPVATYADLDPDRHGSVRGTTEAGVVTLKVGRATPGDQVFVHVYTPDQVLPVGWATVDDDRSVVVDLSAIGSGYAAVTVQGENGDLLGWAPVSLGGGTTDESDAAATTGAPASPDSDLAPVSSDRVWIGTSDGVLLAIGALVLAAVSLLTGFRRTGSPA